MSGPIMSAKKYATAEPLTVLNKFELNAAPINSHHGAFESNALKSAPIDTVDIVFIRSLVIAKQQMNNIKQAMAIAVIENCQLVATETPICD